jgi:hypothetical protein
MWDQKRCIRFKKIKIAAVFFKTQAATENFSNYFLTDFKSFLNGAGKNSSIIR